MNGCWLPSKMMETAYLNCSKKENVNSDLFMQQKHLKEWKYYIAKQWKTDRILCNSVGHCTAFVNVKEAFKPKEMKTDGRWNLLEGVKSTRNKIMKKRKFWKRRPSKNDLASQIIECINNATVTRTVCYRHRNRQDNQ